mmetsp:Transcript_24429/g.96365  ORF Transcript_24429/g.96365 Transcript_24429/m.96365 type:complete len:184 (+) Transcript_24429:869-1420(+)
MVLEELEHAKARSARVYAEVAGIGMSSDAYHITSPVPDGAGALRAMRIALDSANCVASDIGYINAHATSTPLGDRAENSAIQVRPGYHRLRNPQTITRPQCTGKPHEQLARSLLFSSSSCVFSNFGTRNRNCFHRRRWSAPQRALSVTCSVLPVQSRPRLQFSLYPVAWSRLRSTSRNPTKDF